ncbi:MAG: hypothetical protein BHW37_00960 [Firmicutes bacterium CAG:272_52_7]|nr:MAG: hypothetical protein BHW37_00960 [Firmicutes bacterium CAG:272_52_7]
MRCRGVAECHFGSLFRVTGIDVAVEIGSYLRAYPLAVGILAGCRLRRKKPRGGIPVSHPLRGAGAEIRQPAEPAVKDVLCREVLTVILNDLQCKNRVVRVVIGRGDAVNRIDPEIPPVEAVFCRNLRREVGQRHIA